MAGYPLKDRRNSMNIEERFYKFTTTEQFYEDFINAWSKSDKEYAESLVKEHEELNPLKGRKENQNGTNRNIH